MTTRSAIPRYILQERIWARVEKLAQQQGYENTEHLLHDMYLVQHKSLNEISRELYITVWSLQKRVKQLGLHMRSRGGPNNRRVQITKELVDEVSRDGVPRVADKLGIEPHVLAGRIARWVKEQKQ